MYLVPVYGVCIHLERLFSENLWSAYYNLLDYNLWIALIEKENLAS